MGVLGSLVKDAVGKATGASSESYSTIDKFLSKFNNSAQYYVNQIDTLNSFDCTFEFWPGDLTRKKKKKSKVEGLVKNALDNLTGGLASKGGSNKVDVKKGQANAGKTTFLEYLLEQNLFDVENGPTYSMDMSYYIQNIQVPNINIVTGESIKSPVGSFTVTGDAVTPQANTLNMEILNTKVPIIERIIYPWMREVALPIWSYATQPYSTADITISMRKHADIKYIFVGARPVNIDTYNPSQELNGTPTRNVTFVFDYMFINSKLETKDSLKKALGGLVTSAVGDVAKSFGL